jgi:hypothetical protein
MSMPTPPLADRSPWDDYTARVAELLAPLAPGDGLDEAEVIAAERKLGARLPGVLREFYLLAGRRGDLNRAFCRLLPPGNLLVGPDALYFYEEAEGVVHWGIPFADWGVADFNYDGDDPAVVREEGHTPPHFHPDHDRLSSFLVTMLYWQAVNGGMPARGVSRIDETEIPDLHRHWPRVELLGSAWDHLMVFHRQGQLVCVSGRAPDLTLRAAGRTPADFQVITRKLQIEWDWAGGSASPP